LTLTPPYPDEKSGEGSILEHPAVKQLIHDELEEYARTHPSGPTIVINNSNTTVVAHQIYFLSIADELKLMREVPLVLLLDGYFNLMQKATGQYLDGNSSEVYPLDSNGGIYQDWKAIGISSNVIKLHHRQSGKLLDAAMGREAYLLDDNGGLYQQWRVEKVGDKGFFKLRQLATNKLLDAGADGHAYILEDNGGDYQLWKFVNWRG
jgi:hypothetical protein